MNKKFIVLIFSLSFIAASCDIGNLLDFNSGSGVRGVFKSEDAGETFATANALQKSGDIGGVTVNSMMFDVSNPEVLYLGASAGMYKSDDNAKTWRFALSGISVADISMDPYQSNIMYAAGTVGSHGKIIKSLDGGVSWVDIYTEPSSNNAVLALGVSPANSFIILAGLAGGEVIRSTDAGHTWQAVHDFADRIQKIKFTSTGSAFVLTLHKGLQKSADQGVNWSNATGTLTNDNLFSQNQVVSSVTTFYDLALDKKQSGVLYLGTQQGLFRTVNSGQSWSSMNLPLKDTSLRVSAITVNPNNSNNLLVGVGSTIFKSINGGVSWETKTLATGAEVRTILINHQSQNLIYLGLGSIR
jgi:photosystem II stability/assembly factor-like uncharacterized protein